MRNQRIVRDIADRSSAAFGASDRTTSSPAFVKRQALSLSKGPGRLSNSVPFGHSPSSVAELKVQVDGLPIVVVFPFEDLALRGSVGVGVSRADISSAVSHTLEKIVDRLRESDAQVAVSLSSRAFTVGAMGTEVEAVASRSETILSVGPLELNLLDRTARRSGRAIDLRPREFQLLRYMMERHDKLLTRAKLLQTNLVDVHLGRLRRKVDGPNEPAMIRSVRGAGFVLSAYPLSQN
jgi:DNA-binding CsgD family transcriptional regulator